MALLPRNKNNQALLSVKDTAKYFWGMSSSCLSGASLPGSHALRGPSFNGSVGSTEVKNEQWLPHSSWEAHSSKGHNYYIGYLRTLKDSKPLKGFARNWFWNPLRTATLKCVKGKACLAEERVWPKRSYKKTPWQETGTGNSKNKKQGENKEVTTGVGELNPFELSGSAGSRLGFLWRAIYILQRQGCMLSKRIKKGKQCFCCYCCFSFFLAVLGMSAGFMKFHRDPYLPWELRMLCDLNSTG